MFCLKHAWPYQGCKALSALHLSCTSVDRCITRCYTYASKIIADDKMLKLFTRYAAIGVINTLIHWVFFAICIYGFHTGQALANLSAFVIAVSFSFFVNARFTFKAPTTTLRYMLYVGFMGGMSAIVGWAADKCSLPPLITLVTFSAISLTCGFIYSKFIVFRDVK